MGLAWAPLAPCSPAQLAPRGAGWGSSSDCRFVSQVSFASRPIAAGVIVVKVAPDADLVTRAVLGLGVFTGVESRNQGRLTPSRTRCGGVVTPAMLAPSSSQAFRPPGLVKAVEPKRGAPCQGVDGDAIGEAHSERLIA